MAGALAGAMLALMLTTAAGTTPPGVLAQGGKSDPLPIVTYDEMGKLVRAQTGKVVLVYLWNFG